MTDDLAAIFDTPGSDQRTTIQAQPPASSVIPWLDSLLMARTPMNRETAGKTGQKKHELADLLLAGDDELLSNAEDVQQSDVATS